MFKWLSEKEMFEYYQWDFFELCYKRPIGSGSTLGQVVVWPNRSGLDKEILYCAPKILQNRNKTIFPQIWIFREMVSWSISYRPDTNSIMF